MTISKTKFHKNPSLVFELLSADPETDIKILTATLLATFNCECDTTSGPTNTPLILAVISAN